MLFIVKLCIIDTIRHQIPVAEFPMAKTASLLKFPMCNIFFLIPLEISDQITYFG